MIRKVNLPPLTIFSDLHHLLYLGSCLGNEYSGTLSFILPVYNFQLTNRHVRKRV